MRSWFVPRIHSTARAPESETFVTILYHDQVQQADQWLRCGHLASDAVHVCVAWAARR